MKIRKYFSLFLAILTVFLLTSCGGKTDNNNDSSSPETTNGESSLTTENGNGKIDIVVGSTVLTATLAENSSAKAFAELLEKGDITIDMEDYSNFEKVGELPESIVTNDEQITTEAGDLILYQGKRIVIYYDTNSYNFTRLGKLDNVTKEQLTALLGKENVTVTFRLHWKQSERKILVAYFSATGTTKTIAGYIKDATGADIFEITPFIPYTADDLNYSDTDSRATSEQNDSSARPQITGGIDNMAGYDTIFIGYPIWFGQAPRVISTFLENYDLKGKTIIPFCTSASSDIGSSASALKPLNPGANWEKGKRFSGGTDKTEVIEWANSFID